jgi:hypothetical protein
MLRVFLYPTPFSVLNKSIFQRYAALSACFGQACGHGKGARRALRAKCRSAAGGCCKSAGKSNVLRLKRLLKVLCFMLA